MDDKPVPHSGSRWEPAPPPPGGTPGEQPVGVEPRERRTLRPGRRGALAVAAVGILALTGLGGYAVGHATADRIDRVGLSGDTTGGGQGTVPGVPAEPGGRLLPPDHGDDDGPGEVEDDGPGDFDDGTQGGTGDSTGGST